jgi:hypothetical protein
MVYPEERVAKAVEWAATATIKTTLIQTLHWHCKKESPPARPESLCPGRTEQQRAAWEYNLLLQEQGFLELFSKNQQAIPDHRVHIVFNGRETTIGLNNPLETVKKYLRESKQEILSKTPRRSP